MHTIKYSVCFCILLFMLCLSVNNARDPTQIDPDDEKLLDEIQRAAFLFFWEHADNETGQVRDRALANGNEEDRYVASIAATGFGLTSLTIAHKRDYFDKRKIEDRVVKTLDFVWNKLDGYNGFYYHFIDMRTGKRVWNCELSSIDTALLINGIFSVKSYFKTNSTIQTLSKNIYERVNYTWMLNNDIYLSMGWTPEKGFIDDSWNRYCELMMLLLQAIASPTHSIPVNSWNVFSRPLFVYKDISYITVHDPLFIHQFSHAWFDFYGKRDNFTNYYDNSVNATIVHKLWSITDLAQNFSSYSENFWGITASDTPEGYNAWGGPPPRGPIDGSVVPCAAGGSIPFLPKDTIAVLKNLKANYSKAWQRYGFVDAFNPLINWYNPDVIGIDVGIVMLMAENYRTGFVWDTFMQNTEVVRAMELVGFVSDNKTTTTTIDTTTTVTIPKTTSNISTCIKFDSLFIILCLIYFMF